MKTVLREHTVAAGDGAVGLFPMVLYVNLFSLLQHSCILYAGLTSLLDHPVGLEEHWEMTESP